MRNRGGRIVEHDLDASAQQIRECRRRAAIGHVQQVDARHRLEQFAAEMNGRAATGRRHIERARVRPGVGNELGDASDRHGRMHLHDVRHPRKAHDRCDIADEVVRKLLIERGIDGVHRADEQKRIAIPRRTNHRIGADVYSIVSALLVRNCVDGHVWQHTADIRPAATPVQRAIHLFPRHVAAEGRGVGGTVSQRV